MNQTGEITQDLRKLLTEFLGSMVLVDGYVKSLEYSEPSRQLDLLRQELLSLVEHMSQVTEDTISALIDVEGRLHGTKMDTSNGKESKNTSDQIDWVDEL